MTTLSPPQPKIQDCLPALSADVAPDLETLDYLAALLAVARALESAGFLPRMTGRGGAPLTAVVAGQLVTIELDTLPARRADWDARELLGL